MKADKFKLSPNFSYMNKQFLSIYWVCTKETALLSTKYFHGLPAAFVYG